MLKFLDAPFKGKAGVKTKIQLDTPCSELHLDEEALLFCMTSKKKIDMYIRLPLIV